MTENPGDATEPNDDLTESQRHRVLAVERRRTTLEVLADLTAPVDLEDLAVAVAERETDEGSVTEEAVERITVSLHHAHLPMLAGFGIVVYDPETNRVEACPRHPLD